MEAQADDNDIRLGELITIKQAADLVKVNPQTIRRWQLIENGLREIRLNTSIYTTERDLIRFAKSSTLQNQSVKEETEQSMAELDQLLGGK